MQNYDPTSNNPESQDQSYDRCPICGKLFEDCSYFQSLEEDDQDQDGVFAESENCADQKQSD